MPFFWQNEICFQDRFDAGRQLAERLQHYKAENPLVLGIARGGVMVGLPIAQEIKAELDVIVPRKLPLPANPEAGFGAVAEDGTLFLNKSIVNVYGLTSDEIERIAQRVLAEIKRRIEQYRGDRQPPVLKERTVILTDDGLATGYTMIAAIGSVKKSSPTRVVVAVPVSPTSTLALIEPMVDELICLVAKRTEIFAVASFYDDFHDMSDEEVIALLKQAGRVREEK